MPNNALDRMKNTLRRIVLFTCIACFGSSEAAESYGNDHNACFYLDDDHFQVSLVSLSSGQEFRGGGAIDEQSEELKLRYTDSFGNKIKGTFNKGSKVLEVYVMNRDNQAHNAATETYGWYRLHPANCIIKTQS